MALKATIHKAELVVSDMDRNHFATYSLTIARHPSETEERMMLRLLAFALFADERLGFGKGLCADDEADLWQIDYGGEIRRWIDVGQPDEKWIRKACSRADQVVIMPFARMTGTWWEGVRNRVTRLDNLTVVRIPADSAAELGGLCQRGMRLQASIQDGHVWFSDGEKTVSIEPERLYPL
jgi:uncharacterized protein YaeQ